MLSLNTFITKALGHSLPRREGGERWGRVGIAHVHVGIPHERGFPDPRHGKAPPPGALKPFWDKMQPSSGA